MMRNFPQEFNNPSVGVAGVRTKGKENYLFMHVASWLTKKEADNIEELGKKLIEIAEYLRESKKLSGSHRDA
jgi:hypothetical protein